MTARNLTSLVVTTFGTDSYYTQACLEAVRRWKNHRHELIVVTHDESTLLRAYLEASLAEGLIDRLVFAESRHGHTRSFNLGAAKARGDVVFNICNDILIGPSLVDDCAWELRRDPQLGLIGWHWYNEGTLWKDGAITTYALRDANHPDLTQIHVRNIENAPWFTGRYFDGIGGKRWIHLCNTSFFGIRREVLDQIGGGFGPEYPHYWADDFMCYAVLDLGLDVRDFDRRFRRKEFFFEFQYANTDVQDRHRHDDRLNYDGAFLDSIRLMPGGMRAEESVLLHLLGRAVPDRSTVTNVGVWRGSSAVVLLDALRDKQIEFHFIDCFDLPGISAMSGQPPVTEEEFRRNIAAYVGRRHAIQVTRANTLDLSEFPRSDFFFVDAGHTQDCIAHDARLVQQSLSDSGIAAFHDYGQPLWPAVKPALDDVFPELTSYVHVGVYRNKDVPREAYHWNQPSQLNAV